MFDLCDLVIWWWWWGIRRRWMGEALFTFWKGSSSVLLLERMGSVSMFIHFFYREFHSSIWFLLCSLQFSNTKLPPHLAYMRTRYHRNLEWIFFKISHFFFLLCWVKGIVEFPHASTVRASSFYSNHSDEVTWH